MSSRRSSESSCSDVDTSLAVDNTKQIFKTKTQASRQKRSKKYTRDAAIEMAVSQAQAKMPGPITSALAGLIVKLKFKMN